jgi:cell division ATPase FtsA
MPTLLLTGGGSQMRDIEKLFSRELDIIEARTVHPEYGFTEESMLEHISSPADATVASLLVYGAKRGSCTVGLGPKQPEEQRNVTDNSPRGLSDYNNTGENRQEPTTPKVNDTVHGYPPTTTPVSNTPDDEDDLEPEPKHSFFSKIGDKINKWGSTIIGNNDEEGEW